MFTILLAEGSTLTIWKEYGLPGLVIGALFSLVVWVIHNHRSERDTWRKDHSELVTKSNEASKENTKQFVDLHREMFRELRKHD